MPDTTCPWEARCGGCDLADLDGEARRTQLAERLAHTLGWPPTPEVVPSPSDWGHRARIDLQLDDGRVGYRAPRSHELVEVGTCGIARPEVQEALAALRQYTSSSSTQGLSRVQLRSDGSRVVFAFSSKGSVPRAVREGLADLGDVALDGRALHGDPVLWLEVGGLRLRASPHSFYQVNLDIDELLVQYVRDVVGGLHPERVLDVYSGMGNLSLPLAADGWRVVAVEREGQAMGDLRASAREAGLEVEAISRPAERVDYSRLPADVIVLDPPRAGAGKIIDRLLDNRPRALVYVSCYPATLARDLRQARKRGYRLTSLRCFDMFPHTRHLETVAVVER